MPKTQRKRASKTSSGNGIKHKRSPQTHAALIMMNKGMYVGVAARWKIKK